MAWLHEGEVHANVGEIAPDRRGSWFLKECIYCQSKLAIVDLPDISEWEGKEARICKTCGWWHVDLWKHLYDPPKVYSAYGRLRALDLSNLSLPVEEIRRYLIAKYDARFLVDPFVFENTVADVFRGLGYSARVTNRSGDWGIDIYLDGPDDTLIGVQVKRWRNDINVEQITALTGALIINDCTKGIFVTTSRYRSGAIEATRRSTAKGFPIELIDAMKFYEILQITQMPLTIDPKDPSTPWGRVYPTCFTGRV